MEMEFIGPLRILRQAFDVFVFFFLFYQIWIDVFIAVQGCSDAKFSEKCLIPNSLIGLRQLFFPNAPNSFTYKLLALVLILESILFGVFFWISCCFVMFTCFFPKFLVVLSCLHVFFLNFLLFCHVYMFVS